MLWVAKPARCADGAEQVNKCRMHRGLLVLKRKWKKEDKILINRTSVSSVRIVG